MKIKSVKKMNNVYDNNNLDHYQVTTMDNIICDVPIAEDNTDYQEIQEWVEEGNTIEEAD
jgi:hypothetical protein